MKRKILCALVIACLVSCVGIVSPDRRDRAVAASAWVERMPAGDVNGNWLACASDATGQKLLAGDNRGQLWISADCGASWSKAGAPAGDMVRYWQACASDADGSTLVAGVYGGRLYTSKNFGASWTAAAPGGLTTDQNWKAVACDANGLRIIASVWNGRVYGSADAGAKWVELRPAGDVQRNWQAVACDASGRDVMALTRNNGAYGSGDAYASGDAGATWIVVHPAGEASPPWKACAMDADGATIVTAAYPGRLYCSVNAGTTWAELRPAGDVDRNWQAVAVDADGFHIIATEDGGSVWTSSNGGATWSDAQPAGVTAAAWQCCASSADGSRLVAGAYQGRLYTGLATWSLSYACTAGGVITGATSQTVNHGAGGTSVTAVPQAGYHFVSWSDGSTVNPRTDTNVTADITVTATFAVDTFAVTASAGEHGTIDPSGSVSVNYGSTQSFSINPVADYHALDVLVDGSSVGAVTTYTFTNVMANHTIAATFDVNFWVVTIAANTRIVETTLWSQNVSNGGTATFTIMPKTDKDSDQYWYMYSTSRNGATAVPLATSSDFFTTRNVGQAQDLTFAIITSDTTIVVNLFRRGDINGSGGGLVPDGTVDGSDASVLIDQWRKTQGTGDGEIPLLVADLDNNTKVDVVDLSMMMSLWQGT
jgi:hypothetical protein